MRRNAEPAKALELAAVRRCVGGNGMPVGLDGFAAMHKTGIDACRCTLKAAGNEPEGPGLVEQGTLKSN